MIEVYGYLASISNITFNTTSDERAVTYDASIYSIKQWQDCQSYGVMFGYASDLFKLIPQVCHFGRDRFLEEANSGGLSANSLAIYRALETQISSWEIPREQTGHREMVPATACAAYIYQEALLIYLHEGFYASDVANLAFRQKLDRSITKLIPLLESIQQMPSISSLCSILLWPSVILGSCIHLPEQRQHIREMISSWPGNMAIVDRALQLLHW